VASSIDNAVRDAEDATEVASKPLVWMVGIVVFAVAAWLATRSWPSAAWSDTGLSRLVRFTAMYLALALPVLWLRAAVFPALLVALAALIASTAVGSQAWLATVFVVLSAETLGGLLLRSKGQTSAEDHVLNALLGMAVYVTVVAYLARVPVGFGWLYAAVLAAPLVVDVPGVLSKLKGAARALYPPTVGAPSERAAFGLLAYVLTVHFLIALRPEIGQEALDRHLAVPIDVALHRELTLEPSRYTWSVMPMAAENAYTIAYLLGGPASARLLNFSMLAAIVVLLHSATRRWAPPAIGLLCAACFAAIPLAELVTGSLLIENQQAALVLGALVALWRFGESSEKSYFCLAAVLAGASAATAVGSVIFVTGMLPLAAWLLKKNSKPVSRRTALDAALVLGLFVLFASPPYLIAFAKTRNPLFSFSNDSLRMHLSTSLLGEFEASGVQFLLLAPLSVLAAATLRHWRVVSAAFVALAGIVCLLGPPNARLLYPGLALLFLPAAAVLGSILKRQHAVSYGFVGSLVACIGLNLYFYWPSLSHADDFDVPISAEARTEYVRRATKDARVAPQQTVPTLPKPASSADRVTAQGQQGLGTLSITPARVPVCKKTGYGRTRVAWTVGSVPIEVHVGTPDGGMFVSSGVSADKETDDWVTLGTTFYLQDARQGVPRNAEHTIAKVTVTETVDGPCPK
jgi:hypothetical protein